MFVAGIVLFVLAILVSVALHECGHMWAAQATGMKVRRYFIGFGPTLWSTRRGGSGGTEYGLKALPLGGFCDIAGMHSLDEMKTDEERAKAMYKQATWKRVIVLLAGPLANFIIAVVLVYVVALSWGLPQMGKTAINVAATNCVPTTLAGAKAQSDALEQHRPPPLCSGTSPAKDAGIAAGDTIVAVNGERIGADSSKIVKAIEQSSGSVRITLSRDGAERTVTVQVPQVERNVLVDGKPEPRKVGVIGIQMVAHVPMAHYNPVTAVAGTASFTGELAKATGQALMSLPAKTVALWHSVTGGQRGADTPISMYGAAEIGGQLATKAAWSSFVMLVVQINFFLGVFNLVPLLPLDGGHIVIALYERIRDWVRRLFGKGKGAPVNYMKLMPLTMAVIVVLGAYMLLTLSADILNPVKLM